LTSALAEDEWSASRLGLFTPGERAPGTNWIGGWVDPRFGLDDLKKRKFLILTVLELRLLSRPARSQSLQFQRTFTAEMGISSHISLHKNVIVKALLISIQKHKALSTSSHYEEQRYVF
jgi:hypothetical protein